MGKVLGSSYEFDASEGPQTICFDIDCQRVVNPFTVGQMVVLENLIKKLGEIELGPNNAILIRLTFRNKGEDYTGISDNKFYMAHGLMEIKEKLGDE